MPITNPLPIVNPVVQEVKPLVIPVAKPKVEVKLSGLKYAKPGGNPPSPTALDYNSNRLVNNVPQSVMPHPPQDSYLCNAIR
jgi:hypothetical protein